MKRLRRWIFLTAGILLGLPLLVGLMLLIAANTGAGKRWLETVVSRAASGAVAIEGLAGRIPDAVRVSRIVLSDEKGAWLTIENLGLDWSPARLLAGTAQIDRLTADRLALERLPEQKSEPATDETVSLPIAIDVHSLRVARLELAPGVAGPAPRVLTAQAAVRLSSLKDGQVDVVIRELQSPGEYRLQGRMDTATVQVGLGLHEPAQGAIASAAGLSGLGAVTLEARLEGPREAVQAHLDLKAGELKAKLDGTLNLRDAAADLQLTASAPAMQPMPEVSWQQIEAQASLKGPLKTVAANGSISIQGLRAGEAAARSLELDWRGDAGKLHLDGRLAGVRVPGTRPGLLEREPVELKADALFDVSRQSMTFTLHHPLLAADGRLATAPAGGEVNVRLPDLAPLADAAGMQLNGKSAFVFSFEERDGGIGVQADGQLSIPSGEGPLPGLLGDAAALQTRLLLKGEDVTVSRLQLRGRALRLDASGGLGREKVDLGWKLDLQDLHALAPHLAGHLSSEGSVKGPLSAFAVDLDAKGELAFQGLAKGPLSLTLKGQGFPSSPAASLKADGVLAGSPLELGVKLESKAGAWRLDIDRAAWKSARAAGSLVMPKGGVFPVGVLDLRMTNLADLDPLLAQSLAGSVTASLGTSEAGGRQLARLQLEGRELALGSSASGELVRLEFTVTDPVRRPVVEGTASLEGGSVAGMTARLRLEADGPLDALGLSLKGELQKLAGGDLGAQAGGRLDVRRSNLDLSAFNATWKGEALRLLEPVRIGFAGGLAVDRLQLGLRDAELEARGRFSPTLDMEASLRGLPAGLAGLFLPGLDLEGRIRAEARLSGPVSAPKGTVDVSAEGIRARSGPGLGLPAAQLQAGAQLGGDSAHIDGRVSAGQNLALNLAGQAPLNDAGLFDLRGNGHMDLKLLEPLLAIHGRRARGQLSIDAAIAGSLGQPRLSGQAQLDKGEWQDYGQGVHLSDLSGRLQAEGDSLRLVRLQGRAGTGTVSAQGTIALADPGVPLDLSVLASRATLLSSERMEVNLNTDVSIKGRLRENLVASGKLRINRAEIRIPERMPASIAVLNVREPGAPPPPPPEPGPDIALNLTLEAPEAVFVRGRGLDAELGGTVRLRGSLQDLQPDGGFTMRRGQFSLAGQTLTFHKGIVGFDGARLTDPSLNFVAESSSSNITARLQVTGTAQKPKIMLSSVPDLPQDEVLSQLLFGRGSASLSPFEMVQIASALASLTGILPAGSDPLEGIRGGLGLDRLSVGGSKGPTLEGGRYVAPGVYVGARQGTSLNSTQGTVQIDVTKGLKLEATVGTGSTTGSTSGGNSVGVIYQFEY